MQRLTREQWLKIRMMAAIAAIAAVVIAIVVTDLSTGGADEPNPENQVAVPSGAAATPLPRTPVPRTVLPTVPPTTSPTPAATAAPTAAPREIAEARDNTRKDDLQQMAAALEKYYGKKKEYPTTGGTLQTACVYQEIDACCKLKDFIDPIPSDPRGDPGANGYWYNSDGKSYTLIAEMELPANATPQNCTEDTVKNLKQAKTYLYCLSGSH
jgi:type II secretory pathway pseudopilin PulG